MTVLDRFKLDGKVAFITGGAGLFGAYHAEAIIEAGGVAVIVDIDGERAKATAGELGERFGKSVSHCHVDITSREDVERAAAEVAAGPGKVDILINNAAIDPKVKKDAGGPSLVRLENFPVESWEAELSVGLKGAFICTQVFGSAMAERGGGVILNISSDLGVIAPDQRIYRQDGLSDDEQPVKPVTYSVIKHGLIGLTKYTATYWADKGVRANAICPGGVYNDQPDDFVKKLANLIPMGRMAAKDEYKGAVLFLVSEASSYMTGSVVSVDGGRSCW